MHVTETKHSKLFVSSLSIVKKFVTYNLIKQNHTGTIIQILKDILDNTNEEFIQIKVLETLLPMVNPQNIHLTETLVNNVLIMCLKIFSYKNAVFKNPVSALFKQLMITTFGFLDSFIRPVIDKKIKQREEMIKVAEVEEREGDNKINQKENENEQENSVKEEGTNEIDININPPKAELIQIPNENTKPSDIDLSEFTSFEVYQTSLLVFKNLIQISEGKKKEWITPTTYSKCLALELIAGIICQSGNLFKYLPEFLEAITNDLHKIIKKNFEITNDYIMGLKLSRLSIQIVENLHICYDLILYLLKYAESQALSWQKLLGIECLSSLCQNNLVLQDLFNKKTLPNEADRLHIYDDIINTLTKVSYSAITNKSTENSKKKEEKKVVDTMKHQKLIDISSILNESDVTIPTVTIGHIIRLITECYNNLKDSLVLILELNGFKLGQVNRDFNSEQLLAKDMLNYNYELIKNAMTALLLNSADDVTTQTYLNLFQSFISIYGSISLPLARDSYLNDLCKLAIPNNLENSLEMKDKNLLIAKALFNIVHCVNILDYNSWLLIVDTMQKIYLMLINSNNHMLKPSEEFEIDVIIKNLESNIRKYNPSYGMEEKSVLKNSEERKSISHEGENNLSLEEGGLSSVRGEKNQNQNQNQSQSQNLSQSQPSTFRSEKTPEGEKKKGLFSMMKSALGFSKHVKPDSIGGNGNTLANTANNFGNTKESQNANANANVNVKKTTMNNNTNNISAGAGNSIFINEENMDLQIISNAIDTIFISSATYDDNTIKDISRALLDSSKTLLENSQNPTDHVNTYLHFNLTKLLEISVINVKRIHAFWDVIVALINFICSKNLTNISRFSLDVLTIIDLFVIIQYRPDPQTINAPWSRDNWQKTLFSPFSKVASQFISQNINLNIIYNLSKILQNVGQSLNSSGWSSFIEVCETLIMKSDEILCDTTFKLLEQIINEYLDYLTPFNISPLINILEMFSIYKRNHNISYSAITMFWSAAGIAEKFQKIAKVENEKLKSNNLYKNLTEYQKEFFTVNFSEMNEREEYFNTLWKGLFFKLVNICSDGRFEVRKAGINIFADIFVAKNSLVDNDISLVIINKYFLEVLSKSYTIFEEKLKHNRAKKNVTMDQGSHVKTPKFSDNVGDLKIGEFKIDQLKLPEKKLKFDEESINKLTQPSADEKEWEETSILCVQALGKTVKSFLAVNLQREKNFEFYKENLLSNLVSSYSKIMKMTTPELASSILKSVQEIYYSNNDLFLTYFEFIWQVYDEMGKFITTDFFLSQLCTMATGGKMVSNVLDILKEIFLKESNIEKKADLLQNGNIHNLLTFISNLIKSSKNSEGINSITIPQRLLVDEKNIFEFVDKLSKTLTKPDSWEIYCNFLSSYLKFDMTDNHTEALLRKSLELFDSFFSGSNPYVDTNFIKDYLPKLISEIKEIACLRNKNEYVGVLIKNNKTNMQLWHFAVFQLIKILTSVLCGGNKKDDYASNYQNNYISNYNTLVNVNVDVDSEDNSSNAVNLNNIWEATINCFETIFKQSEGGYKSISRNLLEELLKSCQEMEIQIINFIVNGLLPNSLKIPKEMQIKLLTLLDMGSNFDYNIFNMSSQTSSSSSSISRVCISNLFALCKYRSEDSLRKGKP